MGLDRSALCSPPPSTLTYTLTFDGDYGPDMRVRADTLRLFCTPAVNLFALI